MQFLHLLMVFSIFLTPFSFFFSFIFFSFYGQGVLGVENKEISIMFTDAHGMMERSSMTIDDAFTYSVTQVIIDDDEIEPCSVAECQR